MGADAVAVAIDTGPLHGPATGVAVATAGMVDALRDDPSVELLPYVLSARAELLPGTRRLPLPAGLAHRAWSWSSLPRVDRWLRPARVVHGTNYVVPPSRLPRLVTVYDCWFLRHPDEVDPVVRRAGEVLRRAVAGGAVVHASSAATADEVRELLQTDRVHVIALGAPSRPTTERREHAALHGHRFVLALGTTERRKNLPTLVAAFGRLPHEDRDVHLVLAGADGDDRPAIDVAVSALPPSRRDHVHLLGRVDDGTKAWLLHAATVLAYPSLDEGFGFPLLEAMQAGAPVVASTAGSIPEVAGDAALLVAAGDVDALAAALHRVIDDDHERQRLVDAGLEQLRRFTWDSTAKQLAALYHALADGHA
jgi:glycosyltransferase involved in cell wall biosynthesis